MTPFRPITHTATFWPFRVFLQYVHTTYLVCNFFASKVSNEKWCKNARNKKIMAKLALCVMSLMNVLLVGSICWSKYKQEVNKIKNRQIQWMSEIWTYKIRKCAKIRFFFSKSLIFVRFSTSKFQTSLN